MADADDLAAWRSARTLSDLGELNARWLEGDIGQQPGHLGGPADETIPFIPLLAKLNRTGFVTISSQPGYDGPGHDGARWQQRAGVQGFIGSAEPMRHIRDLAVRAGLEVIAHDPATLPRWRYRNRPAIVVTRRCSLEYVTFGGIQLPRHHIRHRQRGYGRCHRDAIDALCGAWQVTVIDLEWGRETLLWQGSAAGDIAP